jgi:hypothetical protein
MDQKFFQSFEKTNEKELTKISLPNYSVDGLNQIEAALTELLAQEKQLFANSKQLFEEQKKFYEDLKQHVIASRDNKKEIEAKISKTGEALNLSRRLNLEHEAITKENFAIMDYLSGDVLDKQKNLQDFILKINSVVNRFVDQIMSGFPDVVGLLDQEVEQVNKETEVSHHSKPSEDSKKSYGLSDCKAYLENFPHPSYGRYQTCVKTVQAIEKYRATRLNCMHQIVETDKRIREILSVQKEEWGLLHENFGHVRSTYAEIYRKNQEIEKNKQYHYALFGMNSKNSMPDSLKELFNFESAINHCFKQHAERLSNFQWEVTNNLRMHFYYGFLKNSSNREMLNYLGFDEEIWSHFEFEYEVQYTLDEKDSKLFKKDVAFSIIKDVAVSLSKECMVLMDKCKKYRHVSLVLIDKLQHDCRSIDELSKYFREMIEGLGRICRHRCFKLLGLEDFKDGDISSLLRRLEVLSESEKNLDDKHQITNDEIYFREIYEIMNCSFRILGADYSTTVLSRFMENHHQMEWLADFIYKLQDSLHALIQREEQVSITENEDQKFLSPTRS